MLVEPSNNHCSSDREEPQTDPEGAEDEYGGETEIEDDKERKVGDQDPKAENEFAADVEVEPHAASSPEVQDIPGAIEDVQRTASPSARPFSPSQFFGDALPMLIEPETSPEEAASSKTDKGVADVPPPAEIPDAVPSQPEAQDPAAASTSAFSFLQFFNQVSANCPIFECALFLLAMPAAQNCNMQVHRNCPVYPHQLHGAGTMALR